MSNVAVRNEYNSVAKLLHWSTALLIITNYALGLTLDATKFYTIHKQIGLTILLLLVLRVLWRLTSKYPPMLDELPLAEKFLAKAGHMLIYGLIFAIVILGICLVQAHGYPLVYLGVIKLPVLLSVKPSSTVELITNWHYWLANLLIAVIVFHALFALKHHFVNKDRVLLRMLPKHSGK